MSMADRAKTTGEKKQIMARLYKLWLRNPDLRLTQLIENVFHHDKPDHCFYNVEDFPFLESLENYYGKIEEKQLN